jgi:hypothetical protein
MKKYLLIAILPTLSFATHAACQGNEQPLIIAGQNVCGIVTAAVTKSEISISMPAGPGSPMYLMHENKLNKLSPGIFHKYVDNLKKDEIPSGVSHAIRSVKFGPDALPQYANKSFNCNTPHIIELPKGDISKAILSIPNCAIATQ